MATEISPSPSSAPWSASETSSSDAGPSTSANPLSSSNNPSESTAVAERRRPVAPYIPASRAHPSDAFTGYSEPVPSDPSQANYVSIRGLYSSSNFDTLSILSKVYTRPNPKIELGPVDDSVSFVVVDSMQQDFPIVYCSQNFYKLTGYRQDEIVGRNLRFLQQPPPDVPSEDGLDRPKSNERNPAVEAFKKSLMLGQECQASLVNYRRDGEPFLNLISVVPIHWKEPTGEEKEYYVGFQVDLNEALGGAPPAQVPAPEERARARVDHNEARAVGDETWAET